MFKCFCSVNSMLYKLHFLNRTQPIFICPFRHSGSKPSCFCSYVLPAGTCFYFCSSQSAICICHSCESAVKIVVPKPVSPVFHLNVPESVFLEFPNYMFTRVCAKLTPSLLSFSALCSDLFYEQHRITVMCTWYILCLHYVILSWDELASI